MKLHWLPWLPAAHVLLCGTFPKRLFAPGLKNIDLILTISCYECLLFILGPLEHNRLSGNWGDSGWGPAMPERPTLWWEGVGLLAKWHQPNQWGGEGSGDWIYFPVMETTMTIFLCPQSSGELVWFVKNILRTRSFGDFPLSQQSPIFSCPKWLSGFMWIGPSSPCLWYFTALALSIFSLVFLCQKVFQYLHSLKIFFIVLTKRSRFSFYHINLEL